MKNITWKEASNTIDEYLETYNLEERVEEALHVALLALKRCEYFDELEERRKEKEREKRHR